MTAAENPDSESPRETAARLACWSGRVDPQPLGGGLTNANYVVHDGGETFVVRIGHDVAQHGIVRSHELAACRAAHACGLSPEIVHHEPGALVMRYIDATTLTAGDVREPETLARIVELIRRGHTNMPQHLHGATLMFWVFQVCRNYLASADEVSCRVANRLDDLARMNLTLEHQLGPIEPTFCHNDLLPANFLDDGERLWLLDWEYAGWNTPLFDLANLASNAKLESDQHESLLLAYFGTSAGADLTRSFDVVACASLLRESLWSIVQEQHSVLDIDYEAYTDDHLERLDSAYQALDIHR